MIGFSLLSDDIEDFNGVRETNNTILQFLQINLHQSSPKQIIDILNKHFVLFCIPTNETNENQRTISGTHSHQTSIENTSIHTQLFATDTQLFVEH